MLKIFLQIAIVVIISLKALITQAGLSVFDNAKDFFPPEGTTKIFERTNVKPNGEKNTSEFQNVYGAKTDFQGKSAFPSKTTTIELGKKPTEQTIYYAFDANALLMLGIITKDNRSIIFDPPQRIIQLPLKNNVSWENKYIITNFDDSPKPKHEKYSILGEEAIDTPTGRIECWKIDKQSISEDGTLLMRSTVWYAKKIGLVKVITESTDAKTTMILKSYSMK